MISTFSIHCSVDYNDTNDKPHPVVGLCAVYVVLLNKFLLDLGARVVESDIDTLDMIRAVETKLTFTDPNMAQEFENFIKHIMENDDTNYSDNKSGVLIAGTDDE